MIPGRHRFSRDEARLGFQRAVEALSTGPDSWLRLEWLYLKVRGHYQHRRSQPHVEEGIPF
jgi:hypothetical protein